MPDFDTLEPAIDPNNRITFLLDWELTMKCNLDCAYCPTGTYGSHDNSTRHPNKDRCFKSVDFMLAYADLYMQYRPRGLKYVILNVYGGESLYHPDIIEILEYARQAYRQYQDRWHLTVTTTTNAIVSDSRMVKILPLIDEFTVSYHAEITDKQQEQFKKNVLAIKEFGNRLKCVIMMHATPGLFEKSQDMVNWCNEHGIKNLPKQIDHALSDTEFNYTVEQVRWFDAFYSNKTYRTNDNIIKINSQNTIDLSDTGRACCGGRCLNKDSDRSSKHFFVENNFQGWYCSVNQFFLFVKQLTEEIFVNKDCKMSFQNSVGPIGDLDHSDKLLRWTETQLANETIPVIRCQKQRCFCGLCAPKSRSIETFHKIMEKYKI